jgi:hypothetical protein
MSDSLDALKTLVASMWQMENELRHSAWSALTLEKQQALEHLQKARGHLNTLLNKEDPINFVPDQPPVPDAKD